jgi:cell division protein FtsW (lipid II flippase)
VLTAVALVSVLALTLAYVGRVRAFDITEATRGAPATVDLTSRPSAATLEPVTAPAFAHPADRRFAARELAAALAGEASAGLANVGTLARIDVSVGAIERARGVVVFAERLREARARAATSKATRPATLRLFTSNEISLMKPALVVRTRERHRALVVWCGLALLLSFQGISLMWYLRGIEGDRLLLAAVHLLVTLGALAMLSRPDPLRDTILLVRYTEGVVIAAMVAAVVSAIHVRTSPLLQLSYVSLAAALLLSVTLMLFGSGPGSSGAKVNLGPWQPIEFIRLLLILFLAGYLGRRWELLRQVKETEWRSKPLPGWVNVPRLEHLLPMLGGVGLALALFFALRDLGPALLLSLLLVLMLSVARAGAGALLAGLVILAGGFWLGYVLDISSTLTARVAMWQAPWENAVRGGDQIAQAAWALAAGAATGTGPGLGDTRFLPAGHTDLVLASIGEELGAIGMIVIVMAAGVVAWRGFRIARSAPTDTTFFLALGLTLTLVLPMLVMAGGMLGLLPLTGIVTPFLSYGGSAMLANFVAIGLLAAIGSHRGAPVDARPFRAPLRWLEMGLAACATVLIVGWMRVQVVHADEILVKPQLSRQADGGIRYQYNPRVLQAARTLPRGSITDRRDVPLAGTRDAVQAAAPELARLQVALADACPDPARRCYPLGGQTFHLLGDAETRLNWAASNTSFVERDAEDNLRGFDDRARSVETDSDDGQRTLALKRDYRDLVALVRHRWEPDHEDVVAIRTRPRDVRLTIDGRLQKQVSSLVARAAVSAGVRKAAVVVVDAATGELLASVSYPWPAAGDTMPDPADDSFIDRARYGLYPPGSTFKLVTAAAALRLDPSLSRLAFTCSRLPDGRAGVRIPGYGRPIRDDVLDREPHGTLTLRDGLVRSCNAYFAQLAVRLGTEPLARAATTAGIVFPTDGPAARVRENQPHTGYGQGDVLTTPLRMARVAAAMATDGVIRAPSVVEGSAAPDPTPWLPGESARLIAGYMRDAVTNGTGRLLRDHPSRIAGKTGTAELDDLPSHAWFVGFAPAGPATRRIAFAVILEHAGYGGAGAASVAGQVVTAAATLGLVK